MSFLVPLRDIMIYDMIITTRKMWKTAKVVSHPAHLGHCSCD